MVGGMGGGAWVSGPGVSVWWLGAYFGGLLGTEGDGMNFGVCCKGFRNLLFLRVSLPEPSSLTKY